MGTRLWDWGRLGIDGRPRPIHIEHGLANIQWDRTTEWTRENLVPAAVGQYTIRPHGAAVGTECSTMKAFVHTEPCA
jgi:hypothetical protein